MTNQAAQEGPDESNSRTAFSYRSLRHIYETRIEGSPTRGRDGLSASSISSESLEKLLNSAERKLNSGQYTFSPYKEVLKLKSSTTLPRVISIPTLRDRVVLNLLANSLREGISRTAAPRPQQLIHEIRSCIKSGQYKDFIRLDIQSFYPNISHRSVEASLRNARISPVITQLVLDAIRTPTIPDGHIQSPPSPPTRGVPAGIPLANVLGEVVLESLDETMMSMHGISYFRYVDDILVLSPHGKRKQISDLINSELSKLRLKSHPKRRTEKSANGRIAGNSFDYLGYTFNRNKVTVHKSRHSRLISNLARPITVLRRGVQEKGNDIERIRLRSEWWLNFRITGCISGGVRRGWLPYYLQVDDIGFLHHLDSVVNKLVARLPIDCRISPKSFLTAYQFTHNPKRDTDAYIIDFDRITDSEDMRRILRTATDYRSLPADPVQIERLFRNFVGYATRELESDVGTIS